MNERKKVLSELRQLIQGDKWAIDKNGITIGSWHCGNLNNPLTNGLCQVYECIHVGKEDKEICIGEHSHEEANELIYVLAGEIDFSNGLNLKKGESVIFRPGEAHKAIIKPNSICIIIFHPPEKEFIRD